MLVEGKCVMLYALVFRDVRMDEEVGRERWFVPAAELMGANACRPLPRNEPSGAREVICGRAFQSSVCSGSS